jgi:hypothetical protein
MHMILTYLHLGWWLSPPALVLWWARRWLVTPWGRYVTSVPAPTDDKRPHYFITVRHVHWWPPFSDYDVTYRSFWYTAQDCYYWAEERTGATILDERDRQLTRMVRAAESRAKETEEILKDQK